MQIITTNIKENQYTINKFEEINQIKVFDLFLLDTIKEDIYFMINPYLMPLSKMQINDFEQLSANIYLEKKEPMFITLNKEEILELQSRGYEDFQYIFNYYKEHKVLYNDLNNIFSDATTLVEFEKIKNYIPNIEYIEEKRSNIFNPTRSFLNYEIEEIIQEFYNIKQPYEDEEFVLKIQKFNKKIPKPIEKVPWIKDNKIVNTILIAYRQLIIDWKSNYKLFNFFSYIILLTKKSEHKDIYIGEYPVDSILFHFLFFQFNIFKYEDLLKEEVSLIMTVRNKEEIKNLYKDLKVRGASYNNIRRIHYTEEDIYYFRNTVKGKLLIQRKKREYFEKRTYAYKAYLAKFLSLFTPKNKILLYEKQVSRFEESASITFQNIYNNKNVYYLLKKDSPDYPELKKIYGRKIVHPGELRYLVYVFNSVYIIGTEVPGHIFTIRSPYKIVRKELIGHKHKFIFLQHGVMFALSLNTPSRNFFKKNQLYSPYKVVVSSFEEAKHFVMYGGYNYDDLLLTGLPTFDNKKIKEDAKDILIMLTWRPWDELLEFQKTTYYKAILKLFHSIEDKTNLKIVLHPKVEKKSLENTELYNYICTTSINEQLNNTSVLISDYSSVTFDAFYRGVNVLFWWEEKEECLEKYRNNLLLNEYNTFGPVINKSSEINQAIKETYLKEQSLKYQEKYKKIVEFNDNKNTQRVIEKLNQV